LLYNQPYGISDPNAPYINGNPSTGTMGSIPPALSIEHPQREIVKVIQWAYDHGYADMLGNPCEQPTSNLTDQLLKALFGIMNSRLLRAPQNYFVNGATGNDFGNDGLTANTPFATIQKALDVATGWNQNGFMVTINVADGIYEGIILRELNGSGGCLLQGSGTSRCTISGVNKSAIQSGGISSTYYIQGFALTCQGVYPPGDHGCGIMLYGGTVQVQNLKFLNCGEAHMMTIADGWLIPNLDIEIAGSAQSHISAVWNSHYTHSSPPVEPTLTISQQVAFNYFAISSSGSLVVNYYVNIIGASNMTSGAKFLVNLNSTMANGGGLNYLPGPSPGVITTGGQYS
jgi:hypothetical protein